MIICGVFGYSISTIGEILKNLEEKKGQFKQLMKEVNQYIKEKELNLQLSLKVRKYFEFYYQTQQSQKQSYQTLLNNLNKQLKQEIMINLYKKILIQSKFINDTFNETLINQLCQKVQQENLGPGDDIIDIKNISEKKLIFIINGQVDSFIHIQGSQKESQHIINQGKFSRTYKKGDLIKIPLCLKQIFSLLKKDERQQKISEQENVLLTRPKYKESQTIQPIHYSNTTLQFLVSYLTLLQCGNLILLYLLILNYQIVPIVYQQYQYQYQIKQKIMQNQRNSKIYISMLKSTFLSQRLAFHLSINQEKPFCCRYTLLSILFFIAFLNYFNISSTILFILKVLYSFKTIQQVPNQKKIQLIILSVSNIILTCQQLLVIRRVILSILFTLQLIEMNLILIKSYIYYQQQQMRKLKNYQTIHFQSKPINSFAHQEYIYYVYLTSLICIKITLFSKFINRMLVFFLFKIKSRLIKVNLLQGSYHLY